MIGKKISLIALVCALALGGCSSWVQEDHPYLRATKNLLPGQSIVVNERISAYTLAQKHNVSMDDIVVLNRLRSPYVIHPGQSITLPRNAGEYDDAPPPYSAPRAPVERSWLNNNAVQRNELPPPSAQELQSGFIWPVSGPLLNRFGNGNDGVNISAPLGTPVVASDNGIVVYAGSEMKGYGNLVLIRHNSSYVTAYAHLSRIVVDKDAVIAKGDMLGYVGTSGNIVGPQLHFEIREGSKPVDPLPLLPRQEPILAGQDQVY